MRRIGLATLAVAAVVACGEAEEGPDPNAAGAGAQPDSGNFTTRVYERNFVFAAVERDSVFIVPWMMRTFETADTLRREANAWLARSGVWEQFYAERWFTPPTRSPARILPHRNLRLLVRDGDAIDGILFEEGARSLEIILGEIDASWTGHRGGSFEVLEGAAYLVDQRIDGMVLDMTRASAPGVSAGGDWGFLLSGDSAQFVFAADVEHGGEAEPIYRGWSAFPDGGQQWPEVRIDWGRTEAFPPARRDIPVEWRVWSADGLIEAELEALSAEIRPGEGPGPLLPVRALYEVVGDISTVDGTFPVRGIFVHERR